MAWKVPCKTLTSLVNNNDNKFVYLADINVYPFK